MKQSRLLLTLCIVATLLYVPPVAGQTAGRPLIIFVHGRGQQNVPLATIAMNWTKAFDTGLAAAGGVGPDLANDLQFVYYGDIFTHGYAPSPTCRRVLSGTRDALAPSDEVELGKLVDLPAPKPSAIDQLRAFLVRRAISIPGSTDVAISLFLDDTKTYFSRGSEFCDTNRRLIAALNAASSAQRPVVLVAHSMGSLVAFTVLNGEDVGGMPPRTVSGFVSFGSQLGVKDLLPYVFGAGVAKPAPIPRSVVEWYNARGNADYLGFYARPMYVGGPSAPADTPVATLRDDPHAAVGYLSRPEFARIIAHEWCRAFTSPAVAPAWCAGFSR